MHDRQRSQGHHDGRRRPEEHEDEPVSAADEAVIRERNRQQVSAGVSTHDPVAVTDGPTGMARTVADDIERVTAEIARLPKKILKMMKNATLASPIIKKDVDEATREKYYGCEQHKKYGALVAALTGGAITAEEAMRMNPSGGIAGPGMFGIQFESGPLHEHAIRHDATGFLISFFNIGPGYGGGSPNSPLSGQFEGIAREIFHGKSNLPSTEGVGAPSTALPSGVRRF